MFEINAKAISKLSNFNLAITLVVALFGLGACLSAMWAILHAFTDGVIPWNTVSAATIIIAMCIAWVKFVIRD